MKQGERCLVVQGGVEVEGVVKSYHRDLDQVLVAVHKECGGYYEMLRSPQDVRLLSSPHDSEKMKPADSSDTEELEEMSQVCGNRADSESGVTPMDLDSEERDTAMFLASLSSAPGPVSPPVPMPGGRTGSWKNQSSFPALEVSMPSRSAPASNLIGSLPSSHSSDILRQFTTAPGPVRQPQQQHSPLIQSTTPSHPNRPSPQRHFQNDQRQSGEDIESITRIMEISLNASSPPAGQQTYRPSILYLATSPPTNQFDDADGTAGLILTTHPNLGGHTVSRPINIPVRHQSRELPMSGVHGSPKRTHIAHLVLSDSSVALPASLSSSTSSSAALGSVPTQLGSFSPPNSGLILSGGTSAPLTGRRVRSDVKKCRKVYGIEHRDQWCNQCRWKKACTRFPDPTSPPKHP